MPTFLMISRHSPENCDAFNEEARKVTMELMGKLEGLVKKHGIKMLGAWVAPWEHLMFGVFEAPSLEAFQNLYMEPEVLATAAYSTAEIKIVMSMEEAMAMLPQTK